MNKGVFAALALTVLLAGCGVERARPVSTPRNTRQPQINRPIHVPEARLQHLPGLEGVIGADARALVNQFGPPRLDIHEGDARKLQFSGAPCVLDVYLYPPKDGGEPRATYVDARRASDGRDVDRAACVAALRRR